MDYTCSLTKSITIDNDKLLFVYFHSFNQKYSKYYSIISLKLQNMGLDIIQQVSFGIFLSLLRPWVGHVMVGKLFT